MSVVTTAVRYFHTVRYLRARQIVGRLWWPLARRRPLTQLALPVRERPANYAQPIEREPTLLGPELFEFHAIRRTCASAHDWQPTDRSKLWIYNLHYFDDLNSCGAADRSEWHRRLLERWVVENPAGVGDGWDPYPVSLRIVNWVKWSLRGNQLPPACVTSLANQARWLMHRIEHHVLGNHLIANAKALIHAGLYFKGREAEHWWSKGMRLLDDELQEQVLGDGGHFELSPMYHALVTEDLLDVLNILRAYCRDVPSEWPLVVQRMQRWLRSMSHPDGEIAFFNDAALGACPNWQELDRYAMRLDLPQTMEPATGLTVLRDSQYVCVLTDDAYLVCDCAPIGPDYLPAHAHADTLSFELSISDRRLFVNSGTSEYGTGIERQRQRGTPAHNTVTLEGEDSSEVWASFRVARRARARLIDSVAVPRICIEASHDGYRRLQGDNVHYRRWTLANEELLIEDMIENPFGTAEAYFHLHPELEIRECPGDSLTVGWPGCDLLVRISFVGASQMELLSGTWHPRFGVALRNRRIRATFGATGLRTCISWARGHASGYGAATYQ